MLSHTDSDVNEFIQLGETNLNQTIDNNHDQGENASDSSNNLYYHVVQLSNLLKTLNLNNLIKESEIHQVLQFISKIFSDLNLIEKIPTSEIDPQLPVNESYKILAYSLYLLLKNRNIVLRNHPNEEEPRINIKENKNNSILDNSSELLNFLAEEYDLPRNLSQNEIITTIREFKKNENSLSPKKEVNGEIQSLKIKIERLQNYQKENEASLKEKIDALARTNEVQKKEISKLHKQNQTLQSQLNMAIAETLSISKSTSTDNFDDINRARLNLLEHDIKSIKSEYDKLKAKKKKLSAENKQLKIDNQKLIEKVKQKDAQIIECKRSFVQLQLENEQLNTNNDIKSIYNSNSAEVKLKEGENKKLYDALNEISNHLKSMSSEIRIESNRSNTLYELSQKLLIVTSKYDTLLNEKETEAEKSQFLINEYQSTINNLKENQANIKRNSDQINESSQIIGEIKRFLSSQNLPNHLNDELSQIIEIDEPINPKIINLLDFILTKYTSKKSIPDRIEILNQQNEYLIDFCSSLLQFFEQLANSGEMQQWIIGSPQDDSFRPLLLSQCNKIESFLKQYSSELDLNYQDFFDLPSRIENLINNEIQPQSREIILLFQLCSTVNDALRRYAINLNEANRALISDIHELRHEIQQVSNECKFTFDDIQKSRSSSLIASPQKIKNPKLQKVLDIIQEAKNDQNDDNEIIRRIVNVLDSKVVKDEQSNESIQFIQSLTTENNKLKEEIIQLKHEINENDSSFKLKLKENSELKKKDRKNQLQINNLQEVINDQKEQIKFMKESQDNHENDNLDQINKLNEEVQTWKQKYLTLEDEKNNQKSSLKTAFSKNLRKVQKENQELSLQMEKLKNNYEQLIEDTQIKLQKSIENETKLTKELKNSNLNLKQISSDLSTLRVENKILKLRISASDEKIQREENLMETHFRMNILNLETKLETQMESLKAEYDKQFHDFLASICERFKDFFDFNQQISETSVQSLLFNVNNELKREKQRLAIFELYSNEMNTVRSILGLNENDPVVPIISEIVNKLNKANRDKKIRRSVELNDRLNTEPLNDQAALEWEQWAKKLILMVSDNFASVKSSKNIQSEIEEAVMAGISQRGLIKKIGILRSEKSLLKNGKIYIKGRNRKISLNTLLLVLACIRRLQINSGHLPSTIQKNRTNENQAYPVDENRNDNASFGDDNVNKSQDEQKIEKRSYPIISPIRY